ncbi:MAG: hypothetical protein ACIWVG_15155, partial [Gloeotrichia echinulata HAB0833]
DPAWDYSEVWHHAQAAAAFLRWRSPPQASPCASCVTYIIQMYANLAIAEGTALRAITCASCVSPVHITNHSFSLN